MYSLNFMYHSDAELFGYWAPNYYNHIGVLFGKYLGNKIFRLQYQIGLELLTGERRQIPKSSNHYLRPYTTAGINSNIGLRVVPCNNFAIGINLGASAGRSHLLFYPMINLEFGKQAYRR